MSRYIDADALKRYIDDCDVCINCKEKKLSCDIDCPMPDCLTKDWERVIDEQPTIDAVPVPDGGIGELSDGYHTFNGLYYQRMMLFAALVKTYKDRAWKSRRHSDGEPCFGGGWFIVGIDTPQGGFTYHYEDKYFDLFDCVELPNGKEWDGHTEDDVTRLLTLDAVPVVRCKECIEYRESVGACHYFNYEPTDEMDFCSHGIRVDGERKDGEHGDLRNDE